MTTNSTRRCRDGFFAIELGILTDAFPFIMKNLMLLLRPLFWCHVMRVASLVFACLTTVEAQTIWHAELPGNLPERDAELIKQLSLKLSSQTGAVQLATPRIKVLSKKDVLSSVVSDNAQIALIPIESLIGDTADLKVFDSLFMFKDLEAVDSYTNSIEGKRLLEELRKQGLQGLGFVHGGMVQLASQKKLFSSSALRGLKVGTSPQSGRTQQQLATLGLRPISLNADDNADALEKGAVDAIEVSWPTLAKSINTKTNLLVLESNHRYRGYVLVANRGAFDKLLKPSQDQVLANIQSVIASHNEKVIAEEQGARQTVLGRVKASQILTLTPSDHDKVISKLVNPSGKGWEVEGPQREPVATALSFSYPNLAKKYFGDAAPASAPQRAPQLAQAPPLPVYNIGLTPLLTTDRGIPLLQPGARVMLSFDIGPRKENSVIEPRPPSAEILQSPGDLGLTALLFCPFCESTDDAVLQQFVYRPTEGRSEEVRFTIVPKKHADGSAYEGTLQLIITNDNTGRPFDRINVDVAVAGAETLNRARTNRTLNVAPSGAVDDSKWQPDVVLHANAINNVLTLALQPVSAAMKDLLGDLALDSQGKRRIFRTGIDDIELIKAMTNSAYGAVSALSKQGDFLKWLSVTGTDAAVSKTSQESLQLTDNESNKVARVIAEVGQSLYRDLIALSSDADLEKLIQRLEQAGENAVVAGRPLRVHVQSNVSLPWQYLIPTGDSVDPNKFWGLKFALSVERSNDGARVPSTYPINSKARKISFARYTPSSDPSVPYANEQMDQLRLLPIQEGNLIKVESGAEFKQAVKVQRKELSAIITFLHASSGDSDTEPYLQFDNEDRISARTLDILRNELTGEELRSARYLAGAPLVILNACETGPARQLPYVSFQDVLARMGARGVITTEVSVWIKLGHEMGKRLIERLGKGEAVAEALTAIRRQLFVEKRNPLGLLYAYYGDPAATLQKE